MSLPYLQRAALTPHLRDLARAHEVDSRSSAQPRPRDWTGRARSGAVAPGPAEDVLLIGARVFGAYLLVSQLPSIGFGTIADELRKADIAWVVVALVLAQALSWRRVSPSAAPS